MLLYKIIYSTNLENKKSKNNMYIKILRVEKVAHKYCVLQISTRIFPFEIFFCVF